MHGINVSYPEISLPTLYGLNPSTSFSGAICSATFLSLICFGNGYWTKIPLIDLSLFNFSISSNSSFSVASSLKLNSSNSTPTSLHALLFIFTYNFDASSFPSKITANFGFKPSSSIFSFNLSLNFFANSFPLINTPIFQLFSFSKCSFHLISRISHIFTSFTYLLNFSIFFNIWFARFFLKVVFILSHNLIKKKANFVVFLI